MESKLGQLRQIAFPSADLQKSVAFYRDVLGLEVIAQYDPPGIAFFRLGPTRLMLQQSPSAPVSGAVLYFAVSDIHEAYATLKANGVQFDSRPQAIHRDQDGTFGAAGEEEWMAFFKDPDGNVLAIASRMAAPAT